ncbi:MAG: hypothetical protein LBM92_06325 [Opitutaceae bacterium]|nr:hypothetical protein [Opitutaceae bacterium]
MASNRPQSGPSVKSPLPGWLARGLPVFRPEKPTPAVRDGLAAPVYSVRRVILLF